MSAGPTKEYAVRLELYEQLVATAASDRSARSVSEKYNTTLCEQYGIVQKEYVMVPAALLRKTQELKKSFDLSYAYVSALKPKPTKKNGRPISQRAHSHG